MEDINLIKENHSYFRVILSSVFILFILLSSFYTIWGYKEEIPTYMEIGRIVLSLNYAIMIVISFKFTNIYRIFFLATLGFLICVLFMKYIYYANGIDSFADTRDAYNYYNTTVHNGYKNFVAFFRDMPLDLRATTADYGYFFILYIMYKINADLNWLIYGVIFINAICLYISAIYLYKTQLILGCERQLSKTITILYISSPFLAITAINGLKEVIFVTIIIFTIYKIVLIKQQKGLFNIIHAALGIIACLYFRTAIAYILLICLIMSLTLNESNKLLYIIIMISGIFFFNLLLPFIMENLLGISMDELSYTTKARLSIADKSSRLYTRVLPLMASILGPFPNLDRCGEYTFMFSLAVFMKNCFTVFFIFGTLKIIRNQLIDWFPIVVYILLSISMIYVGSVSLDLRYHITFYPAILLIISRFFRRKPLIDYTAIALFIMIIYIYSTRRIHNVMM